MLKGGIVKRIQKLLFIIFFATTQTYADPIVVMIDTIVRKIDNTTSCHRFKQDDSLDNACLCCIVKNSAELKNGQSPNHIFQKCIETGLCTQASIDKIIQQALGANYSYASLQSNKDQNAEDILKQYLLSLADKALIIKDIATDNIALDQHGHFTTDSLAQFLSKAFAEGKLNNLAFKETTCLQAQGLFDQQGLNTLQLFTVHSTCAGKPENYILKEIKSQEEEVVNLAKATNIQPVQDIVYPNTVPGMPSIYLPIAYFSYQYQGNRHVLSLMHRAPGQPLIQFMKDYKANPSADNAKRAAFAYESVGEKLANFQKRFMSESVHFAPAASGVPNRVPTLLHGDFHHGNIFVSDTGDVSFIDNERMARFFASKQDIANDMVYVFYVSLGPLVTRPEFYQGFNKNAWVELTLKSFIEGYLKAFRDDQKVDLIKGINDRFVHGGSYIDRSIYGDFGVLCMRERTCLLPWY